MVFMAVNIACDYAWRIFWWPCSLFDVYVLLLGLYILDIAMLPSTSPFEFLVGGMQELSIYALMQGGGGLLGVWTSM